MIQYSQQDLEYIFAKDFSSPIFPVLANIYYKKKEYQRALKVCKIGLSFNQNNYVGLYILSKIYIINNDFLKAEKILEKIILNNRHHSKALIALVKIQIALKRSKKNIKKNIDLGKQLGINHYLFQQTIKANNKKNSLKSSI